jgi:CSLREA domain-containing protein
MLLGVFLSVRSQAATFTVNNSFDVVDAAPGNGVCETAPGNGVCTLRAAIQEANSLAGVDTIILSPNTYLLTQVTELTITGDLTITGSGASITIIDGNKTLRTNSGVLTIDFATVNISGLTIRNGERAQGGGIYKTGTLTLINSTVSGNVASHGGGIYNGSGTLTLTNSTVSGNSAVEDGGGIFNPFFGSTIVTNSTVTGNAASNGGGGIFNSTGILTLTNSTISGNSANSGGGIYNVLRDTRVFSSTIANNQAGGGVLSVGFGATVAFQNTILAGNLPYDCSGSAFFSGGNNLMGTQSCTVNGGGVTVADPMLGPLQNNGGPTQTHTPLSGSPAIDGGNPSGCRDQFDQFGALLLRDQRGFRRTVDGNGDDAARCDIGAVEFGSGPGPGVTFYSDVDFDGDGRNDIGVYRDGSWFIIRSFDGGGTVTEWGGLPQDIPVPGDYDGDGRTDVAVYRDGTWFILRSSNGGVLATGWGGLPQDIPVPGDYDGDGKTDIAVYRDGTWFILRSFDGGVMATGWGGLPQDVPVPCDYDGDGRTDIAVYRDGIWFVLLSSGGVIATGWGGLPQDIPVSADYDGDGKADIAVYRDGTWFIIRSSDGGVTTSGWGGLPQDVLVPGDYDGDRKTDIAVYRDGTWFIIRSSDGGVTATEWGGLPQDIPLNRRSD